MAIVAPSAVFSILYFYITNCISVFCQKILENKVVCNNEVTYTWIMNTTYGICNSVLDWVILRGVHHYIADCYSLSAICNVSFLESRYPFSGEGDGLGGQHYVPLDSSYRLFVVTTFLFCRESQCWVWVGLPVPTFADVVRRWAGNGSNRKAASRQWIQCTRKVSSPSVVQLLWYASYSWTTTVNLNNFWRWYFCWF